MADPCEVCRDAERSYTEKPFTPPKGSVDDITYVCECGERFWQYNDHFHLWKHVTDDGEWQGVLREAEFMEMQRSGRPIQWVFVPLEEADDPRSSH